MVDAKAEQVTDPIDLDEMERQLKWLEGSPPGDTRQASLRRVEKQKRLLWENRTALLAAARRLRALESAMHYIAHNTNVSGQTARLNYDGMTAWATHLGWKGTP